MRKSAAIILAAFLALAAMAPAAFAAKPDVQGKDLAPIMREVAQNSDIKGSDKIATARELAAPPTTAIGIGF
jgi:hypothetical protein